MFSATMSSSDESIEKQRLFNGFTVKSSTWISDSHGLYDYESNNVSAKTYRCYGRSESADCILCRCVCRDEINVGELIKVDGTSVC